MSAGRNHGFSSQARGMSRSEEEEVLEMLRASSPSRKLTAQVLRLARMSMELYDERYIGTITLHFMAW